MFFDVDKAIADGVSPTQIADFLAKEKKFDIEAARSDGVSDNQIINFLNKPEPQRTFKEAALDIPAGLFSSLGSLAQVPEQLTELVSGQPIEDYLPTRLGKKLQTFGEELKSPALKRKQEELGQKIQEQEGFLNEAKTAILGTITDPALVTNFIVEQVPNLIGSAGAGLLAKGAVKGLLRNATKEAISKAGVGAAVGTEAIMQGVDSGSDTYEAIYAELKKRGMPEEQAQTQALEKARTATLEAAGATLGLSLIPGATSIEKAITRSATPSKLTNKYIRGFERFGGEPTSEALQELTGKLASNVAVQEVMPETDITKGLGAATGLGALGGALFGLPAGVLNNRQLSQLEQLQQKAKDTGETQSTVLQLPYDPSVSSGAVNHQVIKIHPDGSTSFPSEFNNFYQNPVDELTDAGLKEKYEPQKVEQAKTILQQSFMNPEDQKKIDDARAQAVRVQAGHFDLLDKLVEQKKQKDAEIQAKKDAIYAAHSAFNPIFTEKTYDELGIGKTAYIRRNKVLDGLDRSNPENNQKIVDVLTEHANKDISPATKQKINDYLQNPYGTVYGREFLQPDGSIKTREQINKELQGVSDFAPLVNKVAFFPRGSDEVEVFEGEVAKNKDGDYVLKYQKGNRTNERKLDMGDVVINPDPTDIEMLKAQRELTVEDKKLRENDVFKKFLKKYGINSKERADLGQQDNPAALTYFRDNGLRMDDLLELAYENNFIPRIAENPFTITGESIDNENLLKDYINKTIAGDVVPVGNNIDQYGKINNIRGYIDSLESSKNVPYGEDILHQINKEQLQREANRRIEELYFQNPELATEKAPVKEVELEQEFANALPTMTPEQRQDFQRRKEDITERARQSGLMAEIPYEATPALKQNIDELTRRIQKSMDKMGLHGVGVKVGKELKALVNGKMTKVNGLYLDRLIVLSLDNPNIMSTFGHEQLHALRDMGMFSDKEWDILSKKAKSEWIKKYNIERRYANKSEEVKIEEAIASAFADYTTMTGAPRTLFTRIKEFFDRLRNAFMGMGFKTSDMVFNRTPEAVFRKATEGRLEGAKQAGKGDLRTENKVIDITEKREEQLFDEAYEQFRKNMENITKEEQAKKGIEVLNWMKDIHALHGKVEKISNKSLNPQADISAPIYWELNKYSEIRDAITKGINDINYNNKTYSPSIDKAQRLVKEEGSNIKNAFNNYLQIAKEFQQTYNRSKSFGKERKEALNKILNNVSELKAEIPMEGVDPTYAEELNSVFGPAKKATVKEKFDELKPNFFNNIINGFFDEFGAIKNLAQAAKEGGDVNDLSSKFGRSYILARMSKSVDGGLSSLLHYGNLELKDGALAVKPNTKGLIEIYKPIGNEVDQYQIWKALNREARLPDDKKSFDPQMVARRNELVKGTLDGKSRLDVYNQVLKEEKELNKSVLDIAKKQGLITEDAYDIFANDLFYVPFYKAMEDENGINAFSVDASSKLTNQYFSKALKGGEKRVNDLTENMLLNWSHILSASMKNKAGLETLSAASQMGIAEKVKSTYEGKDVIKVRENGEIAYYAVKDPNLLDCISLINYVGPKNVFINTAKGFNNMLRYGVTLSPAYKIRNLIRDTIQSAAVSPLSMNLANNIYKGLQLTRDGNPTYMQALAGGGIFEMGSTYEGDQAALTKRLIQKGVSPKNIWDTTQKIKNGLESTLDWYQKQGGRFENANRVALYDKLIKEGKSHLEASFAARDLMDFSLQGSFRAVKILSQTIPFFNARLQGLYKIGRDGVTPTYRLIYNTATGKEVDATDKQKALQFSVMTSAVALASIFMYLSYKDDDDFKKREDWDRDNYWWFKVGDEAIRIPKPFEIGAFGTIAERTVEQMADENVEGEVFTRRLYSILKDQFHILDVPQIIKPVVDIYANKDSFTGAPIESAGLERLSKQERITNDTSRIAIALGGLSQMASSIFNGPGAEGMSPVQVDYAIKSYLGWVGASSVAISDKALDQFADINKPSKSLAEISGLASFAKELPDKQSRWVTNFYESNQRIQQAYDDMKNYAAVGQQEKVQKILEEKGDLIAMQSMYDQISKQIAQYRQYVKQVTNLPNMTKEDKENEIRRAQVVMSQMAQLAEETRLAMRRQRAQS